MHWEERHSQSHWEKKRYWDAHFDLVGERNMILPRFEPHANNVERSVSTMRSIEIPKQMDVNLVYLPSSECRKSTCTDKCMYWNHRAFEFVIFVRYIQKTRMRILSEWSLVLVSTNARACAQFSSIPFLFISWHFIAHEIPCKMIEAWWGLW